MMNGSEHSIRVKAFAKINLCLDVLGRIPGGFHQVAMIMQQVKLHDVVSVSWEETEPAERDDSVHTGGRKQPSIEIILRTDHPDLPTDKSNLAYKAAAAMAEEYGGDRRGTLIIDIEKNIPMAAGLAGGSSDCAAVIHAVNRLWELSLTVDRLCETGSRLGSDVPFCVMGQAAADPVLRKDFIGDPMAAHCAIATGRGTDLKPITGLESFLILSKPSISVSTKEVYEGIDREVIPERPGIEEMARALYEKNITLVEKNMINVLENFTLKRYHSVVYTKNKIQDEVGRKPLMSGSGPTVFCLCESEEEAGRARDRMISINPESYLTGTTF